MRTLNSNSIIMRESSFVSADLDSEVVMMDAATGTYYGLNEVAGTIWHLLGEAKRVDDLVTRLVEDYEVERTQCQRDVLAVLEEMHQRGLIKVAQ